MFGSLGRKAGCLMNNGSANEDNELWRREDEKKYFYSHIRQILFRMG